MLKKFLCIFFSLVVCCISLVVPCSYAFNEPEIPSVPDGYDVSWFDEEKAIAYLKDYFLTSSKRIDVDSDYNQYYSIGYSFNSGHRDGVLINAVFFNSYPSFTFDGSSFVLDTSCFVSTSFVVKSFDNDFGMKYVSFTGLNQPLTLRNNQILLYNGTYSNSHWYSRTNLPTDLFDSLGLSYTDNVIFDGSLPSSGGSVQVTFSPGFSMNMNGDLYNSRLAFGGSTSDTGSHLSMTVESDLKNPIQIRMYITGKGEKFKLDEVSADMSRLGFLNSNWNCDFIFMKEDWVFAPDISTGDTSNTRLQYKPTSWHYVDTYFHQSISWASISCAENEEYDVVVEYVELTPDDIYADTTLATDDKIVECYRQTFSIYKRSVAYDPTNEDFGVLSIHGYDDYLTSVNSSSGYVDDDGKTQIKSNSNVNSYGNSSLGSHQIYSGTNFSLTSLQTSTKNVLSFFQYVFRYFPSQVWNAFYFILVCIVVFAFIKLLKG